MNWKKFFSPALILLTLLFLAACGNGEAPVGGSTEKTEQGFFAGIFDGIFGGEDDTPSLSGKSDGELIARFLAEYDEALSAPAYFKEYNHNVLYAGETLANSIGYFMVNGKDFSVDWMDYVKDENSATVLYKDGILYATKQGEESQKTVESEGAWDELEALGTVYEEISPAEFASQTLTRNEDGSFLLNITLTDTALQRISADVLAASAEISGTRTFQDADLSLAFSKDGDLVRSRLIATVDVAAEDGTAQVYSMEKYLKYTSFDASKIVISAPEQAPDFEDSGASSDEFLTTDTANTD